MYIPLGFETQALIIFAQVILLSCKIARAAFLEEDRSGENGATGVAASWYLCYSAECKGLPCRKTFNPCKDHSRPKFCQSRCLSTVGPVQSLESVGWRRMSLASEAKKEKAREAKETRMWADWVEKTQKEISKEAGEREGGGVLVEGVWTPHPPVNLIPDNDWVGETWGVYFSDFDVDELQVLCLSDFLKTLPVFLHVCLSPRKTTRANQYNTMYYSNYTIHLLLRGTKTCYLLNIIPEERRKKILGD